MCGGTGRPDKRFGGRSRRSSSSATRGVGRNSGRPARRVGVDSRVGGHNGNAVAQFRCCAARRRCATGRLLLLLLLVVLSGAKVVTANGRRWQLRILA